MEKENMDNIQMNPENWSAANIQNITPLNSIFSEGLKGKTALVTGGATGLGFCVANRLGEAGASVVIASRNQQRGERAVALLQEKGYTAAFISTDVTKVSDCYAAVDFAVAAFGKLDILVTAAAGWSSYSYLDLPEEEYDRVMNADLKGSYYIGQAAARHMVANKIPGRIVFISSAAHMGEGPKDVVMNTYYMAAKAGVTAMTKGIAGELLQYGIHVNCVAPGGMLSHGVTSQGMEAHQLYGAEYSQFFAEHAKAPLAMNPDQVALVVYALCTSMSDFMVGETVNVNGGAMMNIQQKPFSYIVEGCIPGPNKND